MHLTWWVIELTVRAFIHIEYVQFLAAMNVRAYDVVKPRKNTGTAYTLDCHISP